MEESSEVFAQQSRRHATAAPKLEGTVTKQCKHSGEKKEKTRMKEWGKRWRKKRGGEGEGGKKKKTFTSPTDLLGGNRRIPQCTETGNARWEGKAVPQTPVRGMHEINSDIMLLGQQTQGDWWRQTARVIASCWLSPGDVSPPSQPPLLFTERGDMKDRGSLSLRAQPSPVPPQRAPLPTTITTTYPWPGPLLCLPPNSCAVTPKSIKLQIWWLAKVSKTRHQKNNHFIES